MLSIVVPCFGLPLNTYLDVVPLLQLSAPGGTTLRYILPGVSWGACLGYGFILCLGVGYWSLGMSHGNFFFALVAFYVGGFVVLLDRQPKNIVIKKPFACMYVYESVVNTHAGATWIQKALLAL